MSRPTKADHRDAALQIIAQINGGLIAAKEANDADNLQLRDAIYTEAGILVRIAQVHATLSGPVSELTIVDGQIRR